MPRKQVEINEEENVTPEAVKVTIENKHLSNPHWIELRKASDEAENAEEGDEKESFFVEGRLHDMKYSAAVGAKTVETVLRENGANPMLHGEEKLEITFSPYTGEVISIQEKQPDAEESDVAIK